MTRNTDAKQVHAEADRLLMQLREASEGARRIEAEFNREMELLKQLYAAQIETAKNTLAILEADLTAFAKANKSALFPHVDTRVDLKHGALIYTVEKRVKRIRNMLARLEEARLFDLVKVDKSVDWDSVEKLEDADLKALGTLRQHKERYAYEVKP